MLPMSGAWTGRREEKRWETQMLSELYDTPGAGIGIQKRTRG